MGIAYWVTPGNKPSPDHSFPLSGPSRPTPDPYCHPASFLIGMLRFGMGNQKVSAAMKCLRIYATPDGESHFASTRSLRYCVVLAKPLLWKRM